MNGTTTYKKRLALLLFVFTFVNGCTNPGIEERRLSLESQDQALLVKLALDHGVSGYARRNAVSRIDDPEVVEKIATTDPLAYVRQAAVRDLLSDEKMLQIALTDPDKDVRRSAVQLVTKFNSLKLIIRQEVVIENLSAAVRMITADQHRIEILSWELPIEIKAMVISLVADQSVLTTFIRNTKSSNLRLIAINASKDLLILAEIALPSNRWASDERYAATALVNNEEVLFEIVNSNRVVDDFGDRGVRGLALSRIRSTETLLNITRYFFETEWMKSLIALALLVNHSTTQSHFPGIDLRFDWEKTGQTYLFGSVKKVVAGESMEIVISGGNFPILKEKWFTKFPGSSNSFSYIAADSSSQHAVMGITKSRESLVADIIKNIAYTDRQISELLKLNQVLSSSICAAINHIDC